MRRGRRDADEAELAAYRAEPGLAVPGRGGAHDRARARGRDGSARRRSRRSAASASRSSSSSAARACRSFREATLRARCPAGRRPVVDDRRAPGTPPTTPTPTPFVAAVARLPGVTGRSPCETDVMLEMGILGWIVVGFIAGAISGRARGRPDRPRLPARTSSSASSAGSSAAGWPQQMDLGPTAGLHRRGRRRGLRRADRPARPQRRQPVGLTRRRTRIDRSATIEP